MTRVIIFHQQVSPTFSSDRRVAFDVSSQLEGCIKFVFPDDPSRCTNLATTTFFMLQ